MQDRSTKWSFFILILSVAHFCAATYVVGLLGIFANPLWLFVIGASWVWFAMPPINTWLVMNTPFKKVWDWARS
jgi:hypothetical protein